MPSNEDIPKFQRAVVAENQNTKDYKVKVVEDYPVPEIKDDEVLVRLTSSGVCHSDLSFLAGHWGEGRMKCDVAGHEGSGYIVKHGSKADAKKYPVGTKVGVTLMTKPCRDCEACTIPDSEQYCQNAAFYGSGTNGTWQQYIPVNSEYVIPIPDGPKQSDVGPILCGGVTVYRALKVTGCRAGQWMVITGAGGGLGSMAIQYANAIGFRVVAIDTGDDKAALCKKLGAEVFIDFAKQDAIQSVVEATGGGAHGAVLIAPVGRSYNQAPMYMRLRGSISFVGLPDLADQFMVPPLVVVMKGLSIQGTLTAGKKDLLEALDFLGREKVKPPVHVYKMEEIGDILKSMESGELTGRAVINLE